MNNKKQEYQKQYQKQYYLDNLEKIKQYRKDNEEKIKIQKQEYYQNNREKIEKYKKTGKGLKINRISGWKSRGLISEDYDKIYERYILTEECDNCGIELDEDFNTKKCMDHCHKTGEFRNVLCNLCNINRID